MPGKQYQRIRRGFTLIEVMIAATVMLLVTGTLIAFAGLNNTIWHRTSAAESAQAAGRLTIQRMSPTLRAARDVIAAESGADRLTLQMPAYESDGDLIVPLENGHVVSFYLSDSSGSPEAEGQILWRSVNGTPDAAWSLRADTGAEGRIVLAPEGLQFSYYPGLVTSGGTSLTTVLDPDSLEGPETVTVSIRTERVSGRLESTFTTREEVLLRNKGL